MAQIIQVYLPYPINQSLQIGDGVYYSSTVDQYAGVGNDNWQHSQNPDYVGKVTSITNVVFDTPNDNATNNDPVVAVKLEINSLFTDEIPVGSFLFFGKPREANESSVLGYYSEIKFENDSKERAELFSVGAEVTQSS